MPVCGFEVASSEVSRCAAELDDERSAWRERPLGAYPYVVLDARHQKMRHGGAVVDCAVKLFVSDNHAGPKAARAAVVPPVPWQRCQFRLRQKAGHYGPKKSLKARVAVDIRAI